MKHYFFQRLNAIHMIAWAITLILSFNGKAQTFTDSNLPIVVIDTDMNSATNLPLEILDNTRVLGSMKVIARPGGARNYLSDINTTAYLNYNGRINIETRGSSTQNLPKKAYGLTTIKADNISNNNVSLLGMPAENDWIFNAMGYDPSLIRDYLSYNLSRQIGEYASRTAYCEMVINGEYRGLYLLEEKIKADSKRVDVLKIAPTDITAPNISGGYITKSDKTTGGDPIAWYMLSYAQLTTAFIHDLPKPTEVTAAQDSYIHDQFNSLATTAFTHNASLTAGYPSIIDIPTFVDFIILNELASNVDGYQLSTFFHKDRNGKLRAGPIWDFNLTYGNDLASINRSRVDVWQFDNGDNDGATFWRDLYNNTEFKCYLSKRWNQLILPGQPLNHEQMVVFIDEAVAYISEAAVRENERWGTSSNQLAEINNIKTFVSDRITWITNHVGSFAGCNNVVTPGLVIDKINYNPQASASFPVSNDQEFIEIKNIQTTTVNLTGIYFQDLGISYRFPDNATILPNQSIYLASNSAVFQSRYGITAFDQFTRNLSNSSEKLILADAFGNIIDYVEYQNHLPWPQADGNGSYLQLISTDLDNSLASSWVAANDITLANNEFSNSNTLAVYPNPVSNMLTVHDSKGISEIKIFDLIGKLVFISNENSGTITIDFRGYTKGVYFLVVSDSAGLMTKKIIKR